MNLAYITAMAIERGSDAFNKHQDIIERSVNECTIESINQENLSEEEMKDVTSKAFECIELKNGDEEYICVLVGNGTTESSEKESYIYFWFVWIRDGESYKYYNYIDKESVDKELREINMSNLDLNIITCKRIIDAMINGEVVVGQYEYLINEAKKDIGEGYDKLFTCIKHNGRVIVGLQENCDDDDVDDHSIRYNWFLFNNIESKTYYMFRCMQMDLERIVGQPTVILKDLSKEKVVA